MRVAVFTDNDFAKVNGVTTAVRALVDHAPSNVRIRVYTCQELSVDTPSYLGFRAPGIGIPFYREMKMYLPPVWRFLRRGRADRIDLVHLTTPGPVGLAGIWVAARLGLPIVGSFHTDLVAYARLLSGSPRLALLMHYYLRRVYGHCARVFVPSEATRRQLTEGQIAPGRVSLWRRGVDTDRFAPSKRSNALRWHWNASQELPVLMYVGRLSKEKGLSKLPGLVRRLAELRVEHRLVLAGDGPMREELVRALPEAVFTGVLSPDDVAVAMASADLFLFPSRTDTAGNVVLEAQASGLPVIVTDAGGPCEQMIDGVTGYVCRDEIAFEIAVLSVLSDVSTRREIGAAARTHALTCRWPDALAPVYEAYATFSQPRKSETPIAAHPALIR